MRIAASDATDIRIIASPDLSNRKELTGMD
jgi:hypothetical protein